jgi:Icc-related predicted phosphoesterase
MPQKDDGTFARALWDAIPDDTDIVITHGPPRGILDRAARVGIGVGCEFLAARIDEICPQLHVFGHIHEAYGRLNGDKTTYVNASILNLAYEVANAPQVLEF